ncbi:hypothetical protein Tco_0560527 [Tanacetum coccineum]
MENTEEKWENAGGVMENTEEKWENAGGETEGGLMNDEYTPTNIKIKGGLIGTRGGLWMSYGFLKNGKITWYRSSTVAVSILDETFASHMQQLLGDTLQENDLEPPSFIAEVRSIIGC